MGINILPMATLKISHGSYGAYLLDERWKRLRKQIILRDAGKCVICGSTEKLEVHHTQYQFIKRLNTFRKPWEYDRKYLITLCHCCHQRGSRMYKIPIKYI